MLHSTSHVCRLASSSVKRPRKLIVNAVHRDPLLMFVVRLSPLVAVVIITAAKKEVR